MRKIEIAAKGKSIPIVVEESAESGIAKIAEKSAKDIGLVTGTAPSVKKEADGAERIIFYATAGKSPMLAQLEHAGKLSLETLRGRREAFGIWIVEEPWEGIKQALVVAGSEKRGTIYGIFRLSEYIGVSPLLFWGDVKPEVKKQLVVTEEIEGISKEPSVRYRGFFINDEWPCFGTWATEHFGGFNAAVYDHVFELLLRLKGNYLWPAMWTSSFALDGPGEESAALADEYGVIMGNSHHEPCLRASEEWDIYKGEDTPYKTQWNYVANKEGLLRYWEDGLLRSSKYENIITVGMRGERDSMMQGTKTLADNIEVLKDIIRQQKKLIKEKADKGKEHPMLLAVYKEVETYFYGDEETEGLREWEGLNDIILMLCEDNYGYMRALPDEEMRRHKGGFGMYYHLDYHGSPVSYEWINSTPLAKIWEEMTKAYEYGVKDVWMVNVGDLKGNEFPLSYFLTLAYDYEKWGISNGNSAAEYTKSWTDTQFGEETKLSVREEIAEILTESVYLLSIRRPEALNSGIYHGAHNEEADRMIKRVKKLCERASIIREQLSKEKQDAYDSMIGFPLQSGMNLLLMNLYAGKNEHYAKQGKVIANTYRDWVEEAIRKDRLLSEKFSDAFLGKWKGMELESHIGFTKWNEDGCRYPLRITVEPFPHPRMLVSRSDDTAVAVKNYGSPDTIEVKDFLYKGNEEAVLEIANDGMGSFTCFVEKETDCGWLELKWEKETALETGHTIEKQEMLHLCCREEALPEAEEEYTFFLTDKDTRVCVKVYGKKQKTEGLPAMTFLENKGVTVINAEHFARLSETPEGQWRLLKPYGRTGSGLKAFPVTKDFTAENAPEAVYSLMVMQEGEYTLEVWSSPANPAHYGERLCYHIAVNDGEYRRIPSVTGQFRAGDPEDKEWCQGTLEQIRKNDIKISLLKGINEIRIKAGDAGFILEKLLVYKEKPKPSYLGPKESYFV